MALHVSKNTLIWPGMEIYRPCKFIILHIILDDKMINGW
jgi:hypothetical protein